MDHDGAQQTLGQQQGGAAHGRLAQLGRVRMGPPGMVRAVQGVAAQRQGVVRVGAGHAEGEGAGEELEQRRVRGQVPVQVRQEDAVHAEGRDRLMAAGAQPVVEEGGDVVLEEARVELVGHEVQAEELGAGQAAQVLLELGDGRADGQAAAVLAVGPLDKVLEGGRILVVEEQGAHLDLTVGLWFYFYFLAKVEMVS